MILTPISEEALPQALDRLMSGLGGDAPRQALKRIAGPLGVARASGTRAVSHWRRAIRIVTEFGMATRPGSPALDFSWDGDVLRTGTEAYVLLHELAHYQIAAPARRRTIDFGLGAGPETGDRRTADAVASLFGLAREREEAMASLLGVFWEVELDQPALASFLDQNWLEGAGAASHFETTLHDLWEGGFIDADFRPTRQLRVEADGSG
jgi:hypothetical protein